MLPIMIRADEEAMRTIALDLWEAGIALGARRGRVARSVVLRGALPDLVTGNLLAIARRWGRQRPALHPGDAGRGDDPAHIHGRHQAFPIAQETAWGTAWCCWPLSCCSALPLRSRRGASLGGPAEMSGDPIARPEPLSLVAEQRAAANTAASALTHGHPSSATPPAVTLEGCRSPSAITWRCAT